MLTDVKKRRRAKGKAATEVGVSGYVYPNRGKTNRTRGKEEAVEGILAKRAVATC